MDYKLFRLRGLVFNKKNELDAALLDFHPAVVVQGGVVPEVGPKVPLLSELAVLAGLHEVHLPPPFLRTEDDSYYIIIW